MTAKKSKPATFKANGETYTLHFGTAAMIALEKELERPLTELGDMLKAPKLSTIRDLFAAALIQHHPQNSPMSATATGLAAALGYDLHRAACWPAQQALANELLDAIGMTVAADLIERAVENSPHFAEGEAA